jgi:hypothetical protein
MKTAKAATAAASRFGNGWHRGRKVELWAAVVDGEALKYIDGYGWPRIRTFLSEENATEAANAAAHCTKETP